MYGGRQDDRGFKGILRCCEQQHQGRDDAGASGWRSLGGGTTIRARPQHPGSPRGGRCAAESRNWLFDRLEQHGNRGALARGTICLRFRFAGTVLVLPSRGCRGENHQASSSQPPRLPPWPNSSESTKTGAPRLPPRPATRSARYWYPGQRPEMWTRTAATAEVSHPQAPIANSGAGPPAKQEGEGRSRRQDADCDKATADHGSPARTGPGTQASPGKGLSRRRHAPLGKLQGRTRQREKGTE